MSENIIIQEGGVGKQLTADKLKVNKVGGGTVLYVLESSTALGTKSITENGTYNAEDDGYAGYSQVYVNVSGGGGGGDSVVGRDSDGDEAVVTKDPSTGDLVITKIPSSIRVITPPTNPYGTYIDGQTITKNGMVVNAYTANGADMGAVPIANVTIDPTTAVYDESTDTHDMDEVSTDLDISPVNSPFYSGATSLQYAPKTWVNEYYLVTFENAVAAVFDLTNTGARTALIASATPFTITEQYIVNGEIRAASQRTIETGITIDGKTVYGANQMCGNVEWSINCATNNCEVIPSNTYSKIEWAMIYGNIKKAEAGSHQQIAVTWPRPGDGAILETSFEILVGPRAGQGDD